MNKKRMVVLKCENPDCNISFERYVGEYNRRKKLGKKQYCSLSCYGNHDGARKLRNVSESVIRENQERIVQYSDNRRDEYTSFRFFMKVVGNIDRKKKKVDGDLGVDLAYLKEVWEKQGGRCCFTGWKLILPENISGWNGLRCPERASLDRIDSSRGYEKGNVRFISFMANIARSNMTDADLIRFCSAVSDNCCVK